MYRIVISAIFILASFKSYAQKPSNWCGQSYIEQNLTGLYGDFETVRNSYEEAFQRAQQNGDEPEATVHTIPVVVHIIYDDEQSNITRAQVLDAIRRLNLDYRRLNTDTANTRPIFKSRAADIEVEFALAKLDPNGNCTNGITRTFSSLTNGASNNVKSLINWNNDKYLNIWVVKDISLQGVSSVLGFAAFPISGGNPPTNDGVVIRHDQVGAIGTATQPTLGGEQFGRTLTHEVGHYLGLFHTFQGGCNGQGDGCNDTPPVVQANFGCNTTANTCSNDVPNLPDMIENYMDYSDGNCMNVFTQNQKSRMRFTLNSSNFRNELITSSTATATGITANQILPCAPEADFASDKRLICEGESIQFEDMTYLGNATSMQWTFTGGNPATSTSANPLVTYTTKGSYEVELQTTNAAGTTSKAYKGYVSVRSQSTTPYISMFGDDFEQYPIPNENWHVVPGLDTMDFRYFTKTAFAGQSCVTLQNLGAFPGEKDEMISHAIDLYNAKTVQLKFDYAFAESGFNSSDRLRIYVSDDCGETWNLESTRLGPLLRTINQKPDTAWWPTLATEWSTATLPLNNYAFNQNYILIKFQFENGGGNNFYLDEVLLTATIGEDEFDGSGIKVYPNPASSYVDIALGNNNEPATISMIDLAGRLVYQSKHTNSNTPIRLNTENLARGLYVIQINQGDKTTNQKLILE